MNTRLPAINQSIRIGDYASQTSWMAGNFSLQDKSGPAVTVNKAGYLQHRNPPKTTTKNDRTLAQQVASHIRLQELFNCK